MPPAKPGKPHAGKWVAYYRVSTAHQGKSGLGLEAQRKAVEDYLNGGNWKLAAEYTEIESGKRHDNRPQLATALAACKKLKARLVVAKLDRLSRDPDFIGAMLKANVDFVCADMPEVNKLTIRLIAAVAEYERERISERTSDALQAAKARGTKLGNRKNLAEAARRGADANKAEADRFAANVLPIIREVQATGATSLRAVARALTARGIPSARGTPWSPVAVSNVLKRAEARP
jgi:DNA invertase Pin-like site-specific DNA recombinase